LRRQGAYSGGTGSGSVGDGPRAGHGGSTGVIGSGSSGSQAGERAGGASSGPPSFVDIARECAVPASVGPVTAVPRQQRRPAATAGRPGLAGQSPAAPGGRKRGQALGGARFAGELCQAEATGEPRHRVGREFDGVTISRRPLHTSDRTGRPPSRSGRPTTESGCATSWRTPSSWLPAWCRLRLSGRRLASTPVPPLPLAHSSSFRREGKQRPAPCRWLPP